MEDGGHMDTGTRKYITSDNRVWGDAPSWPNNAMTDDSCKPGMLACTMCALLFYFNSEECSPDKRVIWVRVPGGARSFCGIVQLGLESSLHGERGEFNPHIPYHDQAENRLVPGAGNRTWSSTHAVEGPVTLDRMPE